MKLSDSASPMALKPKGIGLGLYPVRIALFGTDSGGRRYSD
jgi:hypothetical protein